MRAENVEVTVVGAALRAATEAATYRVVVELGLRIVGLGDFNFGFRDHGGDSSKCRRPAGAVSERDLVIEARIGDGGGLFLRRRRRRLRLFLSRRRAKRENVIDENGAADLAVEELDLA